MLITWIVDAGATPVRQRVPPVQMMKEWRETVHIPFLAFTSPDGLHMNDWDYDCFARNLAAAISEAAAAPMMASTPGFSLQ